MTATTARANRLCATCRCQPTQLRTSYSSNPQSPLASSNRSSIVHRRPRTAANFARGTAAGAFDRIPPRNALARTLAEHADTLTAAGYPRWRRPPPPSNP